MIEVAVEHKSFLGEGPVWDNRRRSICWIDILAGEIHEWNPTGADGRSRDGIPLQVKNYLVCPFPQPM
jgi:sugar lactone lactonase YvrE